MMAAEGVQNIGEPMTLHLSEYQGRTIKVETAQREDGMYFVRTVQVEFRAGKEVVIDEVPYLGRAHVDEREVVAVAGARR